MTEGTFQCFICCSAESSETLLNDSISSNSLSVLSKHFNVIFVLRRILNVPSVHLVNHLKQCGSDPGSWLKFCAPCSQLTRHARELDSKIKKIEKQMRRVQKQVVGKMINSRGDSKTTAYRDENLLTFEEKIRSFVKTYSLDEGKDDDDPGEFLEGDQLAKYLASRQHSPAAKIIIEKPALDIVKVEIKLEVEPPPSPSSPPMLPADEDPATPISSSCESSDEEYIEKKKKQTKPRAKYKRKPKQIRYCNCPHCGKLCNNQNILQTHVRNVHLKIFRIHCPICGKGFPSSRSKHVHMLSMHKDDPETIKLIEETGIFSKRCSVAGCGVIFMKEGQEDKHMAEVHDPNKNEVYKCKYCGNEFKTRRNLRDHERLHEKKGIDVMLKQPKKKWEPSGDRRSKMGADGRIQCDECGVFYANGYLWSTHFWRKHGGCEGGGDQVRCPVEECRMTFKVCDGTLPEFKGHWRERHSKRKMCEICGKPYSSCQHYRADKYEEGPRICEICGESKATYYMMSYHKSSVHKVNMKGQPIQNVEEDEEKLKEMKKVLCNLCGNTYADKKSLNTHVRLKHEKEFNLSCHLCGLKIAHKRQLHIHLFQVHREDPVTRKLEEEDGLCLIRCGVKGCPRICLKKEEMDKHVDKVHKGGLEKEAKRFECTVCGKVFYVRAKLVYHEKVHERDRNNGKPVKCETCGKGFDTRHYLRCHQRAVHKY